MIELYCDGSCLDNQTARLRRAGAGYVAVRGDERIAEGSELAGEGEDVSNNTAEYDAVIAALQWRREEFPDTPVRIYTDSNLIVNQVRGRWSCNADHLEERRDIVRVLMSVDGDVINEIKESKHINRAHNLAQAGAREEEPPEGDGPPKRTSSSGSDTDLYAIESEVLDEVPGPIQRPNDSIIPSNIPDELARRVQWLNWMYKETDRGTTKMPIDPTETFGTASSTDPDTWTDIATAIDNVDGNVEGIGYVLVKQDPFVAIDFDDVRDPDTGEIDDWAMDIVEELDSYTHISVSSAGLHTYVRADGVPADWTNKSQSEKAIEVYDGGRFMTFTGRTLSGGPEPIREIPDFGAWLLDLEGRL